MAVSGGSTVVLKPAMRYVFGQRVCFCTVFREFRNNMKSAIFCVTIKVGEVKKNV